MDAIHNYFAFVSSIYLHTVLLVKNPSFLEEKVFG